MAATATMAEHGRSLSPTSLSWSRCSATCVREARDSGQTVLLSSHILSEVEAVCDRVAMLRAGRIIETGRLDALRGLAALHVRVELDGAAARPVSHRGRRPTSSSTATRVECDVSGPDGAADAGARRRRHPPRDDRRAVARGAVHRRTTATRTGG